MLTFSPDFSYKTLSTYLSILHLPNYLAVTHPSVCCCSSVAQSYPTLCDPMDCSTSGFPVLHHLPELAQTHVHWVGDAIQPSRCRPLLLLPSIFPNIRVFSDESAHQKSIGALASASVLPMNIQRWFPLGLTGLILLSKGLSRVFSNSTVQKHQSFCTQPSLWSTLTSIHDHWKNHSFDYMDLCWQSNVSAF